VEWLVEICKMPQSAEPYRWIWLNAAYLREQAQRCVRLARSCPHQPTAHGLEVIGTELMEKAAELDELQQDGKGSKLNSNEH